MAGTTRFWESTEWTVVWQELFALLCVGVSLKDFCPLFGQLKVKLLKVAFELEHFSF